MTRHWTAVLSHEKQPQILYSGLVCILERSPDQWTSVVDDSGYSDCGREATDANALLIAAAPDLLAALKHAIAVDTEFHEGHTPLRTPEYQESYDMALAAIAKAEGR